jgi:sulfide:quinone oxidoreductase
MVRVIVLGAGFGGIAAATRLRTLLGPQDEVLLVDRRVDFAMGLRKTWAIVGARPFAEGVRRLAGLRSQGIDVRQGTIEWIDPAARRARVDGEVLDADALVIALGSEQAPEAIPGLMEHGINVWDRGNVSRAHDALGSLDRGRLLVGVFGTPYPCPPGPFELALLANEQLKGRGAGVEVEVFGPMPIALPVVGAVESAKVEALLDEAGVAFHHGRMPVSVGERAVQFADGTALPFDLLLAVPPHRCPGVLAEAGLAATGGWVGVDPATLATPFQAVYAIGDCTVITLANGLPLPKAGLFAEAEGYAVAERIAAEAAGRSTTASFAGEGACFAEVGGGRAVEIRGAFLADPPAIQVLGPSPDSMAAKVAFEADRLAAWFGR